MGPPNLFFALMTPPATPVLIVIPARHASTRLPGKPLLDIAGRPMIAHVWDRASEVLRMARGWEGRVVVATDDTRIAETVRHFGGEALMTDPSHPSGTDRLVEVSQHYPAELYVNLQGDEPLIRPGDIQHLIEGMLASPEVGVGTLCHALPPEEATDPNAVKVVRAANLDALYFSRSIIPFPREPETARYWKHLGIYAYRSEILNRYSSMDRPLIEQTECLEQLRLLHHGVRIRVWEVEPSAPGVDTESDLQTVRRLLTQNQP